MISQKWYSVLHSEWLILSVSLKLLLSTLVIISHYGRHLTKSYTVALSFLIVPILMRIHSFSSLFFSWESFIIRSSFSSDSYSCSNVLNPPDTRKILQNLTRVTDDEVCRSSCSVGSVHKSFDLDPIHTTLYTYYLSERLYWHSSNTVSINSQLIALWRFLPFTLQVCPSFPSIEKASTLSKDNMKNYRPVFNLSFLSKILEKVGLSV